MYSNHNTIQCGKQKHCKFPEINTAKLLFPKHLLSCLLGMSSILRIHEVVPCLTILLYFNSFLFEKDPTCRYGYSNQIIECCVVLVAPPIGVIVSSFSILTELLLVSHCGSFTVLPVKPPLQLGPLCTGTHVRRPSLKN